MGAEFSRISCLPVGAVRTHAMPLETIRTEVFSNCNTAFLIALSFA